MALRFCDKQFNRLKSPSDLGSGRRTPDRWLGAPPPPGGSVTAANAYLEPSLTVPGCRPHVPVCREAETRGFLAALSFLLIHDELRSRLQLPGPGPRPSERFHL